MAFLHLNFDNFEFRDLGHSDFLSFKVLAPTQNAALTLDLGLSASAAGLCYIFTLAVRQPPVLASCIEIYYFSIFL